MIRISTVLFAVVLAMGLGVQASEVPKRLAIKAARLFDGKRDQPILNAVVLIEGERIKAVGSNLPVPAGTEVIDLGGSALLPGLIDCHTHLLLESDPKLSEGFNLLVTITTLNTSDRALLGAANARDILEAGFTTVRDVGNSGVNGDISLRQAINKGSIPGPRIQASTRAISGIGGQFPRMPKDTQNLVGLEYIEISSADEARRAIQQALADGADCIKVIVGKLLGPSEMKVIVEEAHRLKLKVAAHAISGASVDKAIEAGVDSIDHGYLVKDDQLKTMAQKGIFLVPTDFTLDGYRAMFAPSIEAWREQESEYRAIEANHHKRLKMALELGVKVAAGSDSYYRIPGLTRGQFAKGMYRAYALAGMSPLEIIRATTSTASDLLGWSDRVGSLEPGKFADIIAMPGDPSKDIGELEKVSFVMKGGTVVRRNLAN